MYIIGVGCQAKNGGLIITKTNGANDNYQPDPASLDWLVSNVRWVWLILAGLFIFGENALGLETPANFSTLLILILIGVGLNIIYVGLLWAKQYSESLAVTAVILDTILAIALLVLLSRRADLLLPLMLFPVLMAGLRWGTEAGLLAALPIVMSYGAPLVPILQADIDRAELINALLNLGKNTIILFAVGALPGFFIRRRVQLAEQANEAELQRLRIDNERGKLVSEMAITLSSTLNYRKVLRAMVDLAFSAMTEVGVEGDVREDSVVGMVLLFEGSDGELTVAAGRNIARADEGRRIRGEEGIIGRTIHTAEAVITHNVQGDKTLTSFAATPGARSAVCAPLRAGYNTYGVVLFCSTRPDFYHEEHKKLLTTFCSQAIIPLQNAQLFDDLRGEQQKILEKEAEARRKLARDLHDGPTQSISAIAMRLNFVKMVVQNGDMAKAYDEIIKIEEIAQRTTQEIRTMLFAMRPVILETQGLVPALQQYVERLNTDKTFDKVSLTQRGYEGQLNKEAEGVVFAIVEEAIGNARKHAQASEIRISMVAQEDHLFVEVRDNGVGFDVNAIQSSYDRRTSLGLINMDERAGLVGGRCTIESARGKGTAVKIEIPFVGPSEEEEEDEV